MDCWPKINYLFRHNKIDAEGLDLEVLKGASNYFGKTEIFMVEAGVLSEFDNSFLKILISWMKRL
jgi:hypothetical protein